MDNFAALREAASHGTYAFPFGFYHCTIPESFIHLPLHWHEELEITRIQEGACLYHVDLQTYQVFAGDFIILSPHMLHGVSKVPDYTMASDSFVFNLRMLGSPYPDEACIKYLRPVTSQKWQFPIILPGNGKNASALAETFHSLKECWNKKEPCYELEVKSHLFHLLGILFQCKPYRKEAAENTELTEKLKMILQHIQTHAGDSLSVPELARLCHFSDYHFMRFFKKHMNMTCIEYINSLRLSRALEQLGGTSKTVTEIALENGFHNISYFNKMFKRQFGMTPREYRRTGQ